LVAENQSVLFMQRRLGVDAGPLVAVWILGALLVVLIGLQARRRPFAEWCSSLPFALVFGALAFAMVRNVPLLGLFFVPIAADAGAWLLGRLGAGPPGRRFRQACGALAALVLGTLVLLGPAAWPFAHQVGLGLRPGVQRAADFLQDNRIGGPMFNNYDVGGYLVFYRFPSERVFVDNRPEAYSPEFFRTIYVPMQENAAGWDQVDAHHRFNAIVFARHDQTPWGQAFMVRMLGDAAWAPVFVDGYILVLVRRTERNREVIGRFEVPPERFHVTRPP
jgi:hypothetical protein